MARPTSRAGKLGVAAQPVSEVPSSMASRAGSSTDQPVFEGRSGVSSPCHGRSTSHSPSSSARNGRRSPTRRMHQALADEQADATRRDAPTVQPATGPAGDAELARGAILDRLIAPLAAGPPRPDRILAQDVAEVMGGWTDAHPDTLS